MQHTEDLWKLYEIEEKLGHIPRVFEQTPIDITHTLLFGDVLLKSDSKKLLGLLQRANLSKEYLIRIAECVGIEQHISYWSDWRKLEGLLRSIDYIVNDSNLEISGEDKVVLDKFLEHFDLTLENLNMNRIFWRYKKFAGDFEKSPNKGHKHRLRGRLFQETLKEREEAILDHIRTNDEILGEYLQYMLSKCGAEERELHHIGTEARSYVLLCPVHTEATPSLVVCRSKNVIKCFGCGKAGSLITFFVNNFDYPRSMILRRSWQWLKDQQEG